MIGIEMVKDRVTKEPATAGNARMDIKPLA